MAPEVAEVVWYAEDSVSPLTVAKPAAFASNDLLIAVIVQHNNPSAQSDLSVSADWTLEGNYDGVTSDAKIFSHVYDPADPSTWDFVYRATADVCLGLFRITGADQAPVVTVTSTAFGSTTSSMDAPDLSPAGSDDLLISIICDHGNGGAFTVTDPPGMTDLGQVQVANLYMAMAAAHEALVSNANTGVRTWTNVSRTGTTGGTISIAVKSPASADPLDPIPTPKPPPWLMIEIAQAQMAYRRSDPSPGVETGTAGLVVTASSTAVKVASCSGRTGLGLASAGTETRTDVYVAETFSSTQSDGGGDGKAITTARTYTGDYLIVAVTDSQSATPPTAPGGWTEITIPDTDSGTNFEVHVYRLLNPAAQTTYTWTVVGGRRTIIGALVRGADTTTLLDEADSLETVSGTSHASPSVTTLGTNRAILAFDVLRGFPTSAWSQASGWLEYIEAVGGDATTNMQVSLQARTAPTAGAYSDTFTCANAEPAIVVLLAVIPAVGAGGGATAEVGTALTALRSAGTATKTAVQTGTAKVGLAAAGSARKTASASGSTTVALTSTGNAARNQTGTSTVGLSGRAAASKSVSRTGTTQVALTSTGTARKTAVVTGRALTALLGTGAEVKRALPSGTATTGLRTTGAVTPQGARNQTGTTALGGCSTGTARKSTSVSSRSLLAAGTSGLEQKRAAASGQATLALTASRSPADIRSAVGRCALTLVARHHSCTTYRPVGGITTRPSSGITVYSLATTARPSSGVTTRPDTGLTEDPC